MEDVLVKAIDEGRISLLADPGVEVSARFELGLDHAKIWCFGPETTGSNMVVNMCDGVPYLNEIKDSVVAGFQFASKKGVLANENMRGICFNVCDAVLNPITTSHLFTQINQTTIRIIHSAQFSAKPRLVKPVYLVEIQSPKIYYQGICSELISRRRKVIEEISKDMMLSDPLDACFDARVPVTTICKMKRLEHVRVSTKYVTECEMVQDCLLGWVGKLSSGWILH
nr:hypothetical protein [Tanacetum cinerariifolium]